MARPKVYSIRLTDDERSKLNKVIKNKTTCKTVLKRCQILRDLDETKGCGLTHAQIAHTYAVCPATVSNLIRDYGNKGIDSIIRYNISPNSAASLRKADGRVEAKLIPRLTSTVPVQKKGASKRNRTQPRGSQQSLPKKEPNLSAVVTGGCTKNVIW